MSLAEILNLNTIRTLADAKSFQRGLAYFHEAAVGRLEVDAEGVRASVEGTQHYRVALGLASDARLSFNCNCPVGQGGVFCKHAVAVALAWLENTGEEVLPPPEAAAPKRKRLSKIDQVTQYLDTLNERELKELLLKAVENDRGLRDKLLFAAKAKAGTDSASLRAAVRQACRIHGFLGWGETSAYAEQLEALASLLAQRIADGHPELVEIIEEAIAAAEGALEQVDDSNGEVGSAIASLASIHCQACCALQPEPVALAERLFRFQINDEWGFFSSIIPEYLDALGQAGMARYRELLAAAWAREPALPPPGDGVPYRGSSCFTLEQAMLALAELDEDFDWLVRIKAKDLSSPRRFLDLAELFLQQQRYDEALNWAEQGIAAFPGQGLEDLLAFAINEQIRRNNPEAAAKLIWQRFQQDPGRRAFFPLLKEAARIGLQQELREKALALLWQQVRKEESQTTKARSSIWRRNTRNDLLEICLEEKDGEQAWQILKDGPTSMQHWEKTAALRGKTHPEDAIGLYFKLLPQEVENGTRNARYEAASRIVLAIGKLRQMQGETARFSEELARIKQQYKAKRNFMKALAAWGVS